ncbi:Biotin transporter [Burkholderiales bacterium 8X]|nr:Biotin transporter [Burkholderiales bacterium 8X]
MTPSIASSLGAPARILPAFDRMSPARQVLALILGTAFLALASHVQVPMFPVPMTMQTFAVTLIGALYGSRLGTLTVLAWLGEAMVGLPMLAGGTAGLATFAGPTAGYLFSFPLAAFLVGWLVERGFANRMLPAFVVMCLGNALSLATGAAWLASLVGMEKAWLLGVAPFVLGGLLKSALGASSLSLAGRAASAFRRR